MDPNAQLFQLEWQPSGDELVAYVDLPNGPLQVRVGIKTEKIQPAPGAEMIDVQRWAFAVMRNDERLSSGQGTGVSQAGIFRAAYKAVLRVAAMESSVGVCPQCGEHAYPQQIPDKNGLEGVVLATFDEDLPYAKELLEALTTLGCVRQPEGWRVPRSTLRNLQATNGASAESMVTKIIALDDRIVCTSCNNDPSKRNSCRGCYTIGYLYRPGVPGDLRCIDKSCATRRPRT